MIFYQQRMSAIICATAYLLLQQAALTNAAQPHVEMDVVMDASMSSNMAAQKWVKAISDAGIANVRFRNLQNGDQVGINSDGAGDAATICITAQLKSNGTIQTPGGQFSLSDGGKLKKWLDDVKSGAALPGHSKTVFGLTPKQLDEVKKALATPVSFNTKDMRPEKAVQQIEAALTMPFTIDPTIEAAIAADDPVRDELKGVAAGTALAAIARPAGGVLAPRANDKGVGLALVKPQTGGDLWPIGWPPEGTDEAKTLPVLYKFIPVEIEGVPATQAIDALQSRINVPFLFDYNNMVRGRVDLKKPVKLAPGKSFYRQILDTVLFQAGLKAEVRVDDAGTPFVWITTL
ncbi:MAG TPA: hypothetical protein VGI75_14115 [Pirellulales bacterium]